MTELIGQIPPLAETETPPAARTANADIRMRVSKFKNDSAAVGCDSLSLCNNLGVGFAMIAVNYPGRPHRPLPSHEYTCILRTSQIQNHSTDNFHDLGHGLRVTGDYVATTMIEQVCGVWITNIV